MTELSAKDLIARIDDIGTCMFTTVDSSQRLVSRPMSVSHIDEHHRLWFFSPAESEKVDDVLGDGHVNLAFVADKTWISVAGTAEVVDDAQKKQELEDLGAKAYFAKGADDSEAWLISVDPETAQYWEGPGKAVALVKLVASAVTDSTPSMGDKGHVEF
ncbi:pyridoxamine 5'-phosphate oxidase family protein [Nesterenkonia haasae]|uniref:pyridoxamine 5'-phosphate oxidase family protein n=1 Tax=Nesterenkonia haasae TaxID=2587813 RepID=UPI0013908B52|nr:pyridoxamine 5'-phosphate oxidase family protein [Nesterenkonia haasae]NDK32939.1 pyridoxamine 5'-phosphate oxidase [Nesterenkonia haasae]